MEEVEEQQETAEAEEPNGQEPTEASLEELLARKSDESGGEEETEEETVVTPGRDERIETLTVKVVPQQPTEFTCKKCFLVKHRSQLAEKKRMYCRDCA